MRACKLDLRPLAIQLVHDTAILPDLARRPRELDEVPHLHHGRRELGLPRGLVPSVLLHHRCRIRRAHQVLVRGEQHLVRLHVLIVLVGQPVRGHNVLGHDAVDGRVLRAHSFQDPRKGPVDRRVLRRVEAVREGGAVRPADGVGTRERHHLLGRHALVREEGLVLGEAEEGGRQVLEDFGLEGDAAVEAARGDGVGDAAQEEGGVAGREGDDVGAGHDPGAAALQLGLRLVDHLEAAQAREVGPGCLLGRRVGSGRVEEDGGVAALHVYVDRGIYIYIYIYTR